MHWTEGYTRYYMNFNHNLFGIFKFLHIGHHENKDKTSPA